MHSTRQPSPSHSVLVRSSLCIPPTGNPPLQSVRVCPAFVSATTVHCVFHLPQSKLVLSIPLIHIILFVQLSSHCLRIQRPHPQRAFTAHHVLGHRSPPRHSCATDFPLPSCTFSARHLWVTVIFGRGFQVVFLHFAALLLQSLQHQSSLLLNCLPLGNQLIHIILSGQLSSPADPASPPTKGIFRPTCSWPPLSSSPQLRH